MARKLRIPFWGAALGAVMTGAASGLSASLTGGLLGDPMEAQTAFMIAVFSAGAFFLILWLGGFVGRPRAAD